MEVYYCWFRGRSSPIEFAFGLLDSVACVTGVFLVAAIVRGPLNNCFGIFAAGQNSAYKGPIVFGLGSAVRWNSSARRVSVFNTAQSFWRYVRHGEIPKMIELRHA
jgi:hypothetical protein